VACLSYQEKTGGYPSFVSFFPEYIASITFQYSYNPDLQQFAIYTTERATTQNTNRDNGRAGNRLFRNKSLRARRIVCFLGAWFPRPSVFSGIYRWFWRLISTCSLQSTASLFPVPL